LAYYEVRDWIADLKPSDKKKPDLSGYSGLKKNDLTKMYRAMVLARRIELEEKILLRKGHAKFFIGCGGKELVDVVAGILIKDTDPFVGYYRNKAFDMFRGVTIREKIMEAVGDRRNATTGGMLQPAHSSYPDKAILPQASPTGSHALEASGLGDAIKNKTPIKGDSGFPGGRFPSDSLVFCAIGEGSTSSAEFGRAVFYTVFGKTPNIFGIYNCGWAIATSVEEQFPEGNPTTCFEGYQRFGLKISNFDGTDIKESLKEFKAMVEHVRSGKGPAIANINVVRLESHSGSDDQSHYMEKKEQEHHINNDPLRKAAKTLIDDGIYTPDQIVQMFNEIDNEVKSISADVTSDIEDKSPADILTKVYSYDFDKAQETWGKYLDERRDLRREKYKEFHEKGILKAPDLPEDLEPMTMRAAINYTLFDLFILSDDCLLFGEDVADFPKRIYDKGEKVISKYKGKGGVFLVSHGLQRAFGPDRVFNTPLDEAGILGRAQGHSYQGRIPLPEIQFIDYMSPGYQQLKDRISSVHQRSNQRYKLPMVIRTSYGGYKQGAGAMWHSEANLGSFINIPGLDVVIPAAADDAAGLLRTAYTCGNPVLFCEAVALYNRPNWEGLALKTKFPPIEELIPFGKAKVYNEKNKDILIISYGITLPMCRKIAERLAEKDIGARVLDLRTVKPIDWQAIEENVKACAKVLVVAEDRFHGGVGPTISAFIGDKLFDYLDGPVKLITAEDARVAYGMDGDYICLPNSDQIMKAAENLFEY